MIKSFKIAGQTINIVEVEEMEDYGQFNDATNTITIAKTVKVEGESIPMSDSHKLNTLWHEIFHVFQFYYGCEYSETEAQVYANFMCEFLKTKKG